MEVEGRYGGDLVKLDINKVLLSRNMEMKDKRIQELTLQNVCIFDSNSVHFYMFCMQFLGDTTC